MGVERRVRVRGRAHAKKGEGSTIQCWSQLRLDTGEPHDDMVTAASWWSGGHTTHTIECLPGHSTMEDI